MYVYGVGKIMLQIFFKTLENQNDGILANKFEIYVLNTF